MSLIYQFDLLFYIKDICLNILDFEHISILKSFTNKQSHRQIDIQIQLRILIF